MWSNSPDLRFQVSPLVPLEAYVSASIDIFDNFLKQSCDLLQAPLLSFGFTLQALLKKYKEQSPVL